MVTPAGERLVWLAKGNDEIAVTPGTPAVSKAPPAGIPAGLPPGAPLAGMPAEQPLPTFSGGHTAG